jgi:hypothetical protein
MLQLSQRGDDNDYGHRACAQGEVRRRFQGNPLGVQRGPAGGGDNFRGQ